MKKIEQLQTSIAEVEKVKRDELDSAEERLSTIQEEKLNQLLKIEDLEKNLKTVEQERDQLCMNKSKFESEIAGLKEHAQNLKDMITEKEEVVENLQDDMETQRKCHLDKDAALRSAQDKISELEKKIKNLEETKGREISNIKTDLDSKCKSLRNLQMVLEETKQELQVKEMDSKKFMDNLTNASCAMGDMKVGMLKLQVYRHKN